MSKKYHQVGAIKLTKAEDKLYISLNSAYVKDGDPSNVGLVALHKKLTNLIENPNDKSNVYGLSLQIEKPVDKLKRLCELGYISEDILEARIASVPDYIKYEITFIED